MPLFLSPVRLLVPLLLSAALAAAAAAQPLLQHFGRAEGLPSEYVLALLPSRTGYLWIGTDAGLVRYDGARFEAFGTREGLPHPYVGALAEDDAGTLWVGTKGGLARYDGTLLVPEPLPISGPVDHVLARWGVVAVEGPGGLAWRTEGGPWRHTAVQPCGQDPPIDKQHLLRLDPEGALVVQCRTGAWMYALASPRAPVYHPSAVGAEIAAPAGTDPVRYTLQGQDGTAYVGNREGLWAVRGAPWPLWRGHVEGLVEDYEGSVWFGAFGQGLFRVEATWLQRLSHSPALRLARDDAGSVWVTGDTLLRVDARTLRVERAALRPTRALALRGATPYVTTDVYAHAVADLRVGRQNPITRADSWISGLAFRGDTLLVASYGQGLMRLVAGVQVDSLGEGHGLPTSTLEDVVCLPASCWLVTRVAGALRLAGARVEPYGEAQGLPSSSVFSVYEARDGSTWFGTDRGVARLAGAEVQTIGADLLAGQRVLGFFEREAEPGALWAVADGGMARIDRAGGEVRRSKERVAPDGVSINAILYDALSDRLFVATPQGVEVVEMSEVGGRTLPPPRVAVERIEVDGAAVQPRDGLLRLPTPHARLTVEAALLSFVGGVRGEYRLQEGPWQTLGQGRVVAFPRLAPGHYTLDLRAVNAEGTASDAPARLAFSVPYPWWRHPAALALAGGLVIGLVAFAERRLAARRFRARMARYEAERSFQDERERLSRDLHDYVGGQLATLVTATELVELSAGRGDAAQMAAYAEAAGVAARQTLFQVRQTVRTLRSETLAPRDLYDQLCAQAEGQLRFVDTPVFTAQARLAPDAPALPSGVALQVLRIAQEAVTNVLRHAGARHLALEVEATQEAFTLTLEDDGGGIGEQAPGNGRTIMEARAREVGAALAWSSIAAARGTRIVLRIPLASQNR